MTRPKDETLSIRTLSKIKQLLQMAAFAGVSGKRNSLGWCITVQGL
jgi:hypothetical protein